LKKTESQNPFVESYLLYLLAAVSDKASAEFHAQVRDSGLRAIEWRVLAILMDRDGAMITRLAEYALVEQSRLTRIIAQMDERGLVTRQSDADDGRRVRVFLTAAGRRKGKSLIDDARQHEQALLETLSATLDSQTAAKIKPALQALLLCLNDRAG
jgi:DNA-binding MarR family transcriptional regulator